MRGGDDTQLRGCRYARFSVSVMLRLLAARATVQNIPAQRKPRALNIVTMGLFGRFGRRGTSAGSATRMLLACMAEATLYPFTLPAYPRRWTDPSRPLS